MALTKRLVQTAGLAAGVIGLVAATAPESGAGKAARRLAKRFTRDLRYAAASTPGLVYRLSGRKPDPNVADDVLADRIRSSIGPLEKRLDIPRVHVMVEDHVVLLHGDVPDACDALAIETAVTRVSGVKGVESHLHAGLLAGDTRPSEGVAVPAESGALHALLEAAWEAGAGQRPHAAVHAVLCAFMDRMPEAEAAHLLAHLPVDVRSLAGPVRRHGDRPPRVKTLPQLVAAVTAEGGIDTQRAEAITRAVIASLRELVPEEVRDVSAVLPDELRDLWQHEPTRT